MAVENVKSALEAGSTYTSIKQDPNARIALELTFVPDVAARAVGQFGNEARSECSASISEMGILRQQNVLGYRQLQGFH